MTPNEESTVLPDDLPPFLDSCVIYLHGFEGERLDYYVRLIRRAGGVRRDRFNEDTTHVVVTQVRCFGRPAFKCIQ